MEVVMHHIVAPANSERTSPSPLSRRALLERSASAGFIAAGASWVGATLRPADANAADPAPGGGSPRQLAAFRIRQAAAQAYLAVIAGRRRYDARKTRLRPPDRVEVNQAAPDLEGADRRMVLMLDP